MTNEKFARAYKEVLEIIKYFPEEEYSKIPKEKIKFYEDNMDKGYDFTINPAIDLSMQNISNEANAIIVSLFQEYYATEEQRKIIKDILNLNDQKAERIKRKQNNPDDLFNTPEKANKDLINESEEAPQETALVESKEGFFKRFKSFVCKLLHIK